MSKKEYSAKTAYDHKIAASYEEDRVVEPIWEKEQIFLDNFLRSVPEQSIILDIPVGTGRFFEYYQKYKHRVFGFDISENMLAEARNKLENKPEENTIKLATADITNLPLEQNSVDISICWRLFHLLPATILGTAIKELTRVTKHQIIIQTFDTVPKNRVASLFKSMIRPLKLLVTKTRTSSDQSKKEKWCHIESFAHDENFLIKEFSKNNFKLVEKNMLDFYKGQPVNVYVFKNSQ